MINKQCMRYIFIFLMQFQLSYCGIVTISIPKCGTYLLAELLVMLGFSSGPSLYTYSFLQLEPSRVGQLKGDQLGYDHHAIANRRNIEILRRSKHKIIFIYRDPRDQILSQINYMKHKACGVWEAEHISFDQLIFGFTSNYSLLSNTYNRGHPWNDPWLKQIGSVQNFYNLYVPWIDVPGVYTTTFEKLIGVNGGGSFEMQVQEIKNICGYLEIEKSDEEVCDIAHRLFGDKRGTFHKGQMNNWKKHFSPEHKAYFKKYAGELLIQLGYETDLDW